MQRLRVHHLGPRIRHAAVAAGREAACPASAKAVGQAGRKQDARRALHAEMLGDVPERGRCFKDRVPVPHGALRSRLRHRTGRQRDACLSGHGIYAPGRCRCGLGERRGGVPGDGPRPGRLTGCWPQRLTRTADGLDPGPSYSLRMTHSGRAADPGPAALAPGPTADSRTPAAGRPPQAPASGPLHAEAGNQCARTAPRRRRARRPPAT